MEPTSGRTRSADHPAARAEQLAQPRSSDQRADLDQASAAQQRTVVVLDETEVEDDDPGSERDRGVDLVVRAAARPTGSGDPGTTRAGGGLIIRAYVFTLDPTPAQQRMLASHCGAARFAFNHMLGLVRASLGQREAERSYGVAEDALTPAASWSAYSLRKHWNAIKDEVAPWWAENSKEAYASGCADLAAALRNWGDSRRGSRRGRAMGFPGFRGKRRIASCTFTTGIIRVEPDRRHVTLPRLGTLHVHETTRRLGRLIERGRTRVTLATVSYRRGRWQVSLLAQVEAGEPHHERTGTAVGVDLGVRDLLVAATPDGQEVLRVPAPELMRTLDRRKRALQRRYRNRQGPRKGVCPSKRWLRARHRIDRCDWAGARVREDLLHKVTADLAKRFETVVVEDLNVAGMMTRGGAHKRGLNRAVARSGMATTRRLLAYKTTWAGGNLVVVDRFYPSSKTCSECGATKAKLLLSERTYLCPSCGCVVDRDLNAAVNLARQGLSGAAESGPVDGRGAERKTGAPSGVAAAGDEASTLQPARASDKDRLLVTAGS